MTIIDFYCEPINEPAVREPIFPFGCATNHQGDRDLISIHMHMCTKLCTATSVGLDVQLHAHTQ